MIRRLVAGRTGEPADVLSVADLPDDPPPGPGEVQLAVRTVGLNFLDVMLCRGEYPVRPSPRRVSSAGPATATESCAGSPSTEAWRPRSTPTTRSRSPQAS
ncbi:hypothetical protein AB0F53_06505, partial [Micromonospora aurantiaca]